jgi:hypothetical protein
MASSPNWLQRYREGQRDQVWAELRELGGSVRRPGFAQEATIQREFHYLNYTIDFAISHSRLAVELAKLIR